MQSRWAWTEICFTFLRDGILHTREINREANQLPTSEKVMGRMWFTPYGVLPKSSWRDSEKHETDIRLS